MVDEVEAIAWREIIVNEDLPIVFLVPMMKG